MDAHTERTWTFFAYGTCGACGVRVEVWEQDGSTGFPNHAMTADALPDVTFAFGAVAEGEEAIGIVRARKHALTCRGRRG